MSAPHEDSPVLTHKDCGCPLTFNPGGRPRHYPDGTVDASAQFYCRHCDGYPPIDGKPPLDRERYRAAIRKHIEED